MASTKPGVKIGPRIVVNQLWGFNGFRAVIEYDHRWQKFGRDSSFQALCALFKSPLFAQAAEHSNDAVLTDSRTLSPKLIHRLHTKDW